MKIAILFVVLFHSAMAVTQDADPSSYEIHEATLCLGDSMEMGNKIIKFSEVVSDSRCPKGLGITCIWAGEVKVLVEFYENGKLKGDKIVTASNVLMEEDYSVSSDISIAGFFNVNELNIKGIGVFPYPEGSERIAPEEYKLNLKISEKLQSD